MLTMLLLTILAGPPLPAAKATVAPATPLWLTNLPKAKAQARTQDRLVLMFFHGSDWCTSCMRMQREVFATSEFAAYARDNLILVDVDFPERVAQSERQRRANLALKQRFNVGDEWREGFPTVVVLNPRGQTVCQEKGYHGEGARALIEHLQKLKGL